MSEREPGAGDFGEEIISEALKPEIEIRVEPQEFPPFLVGSKTVASEKHPYRNEDALFLSQDKKAGGVFDGLGGNAHSEHASRQAATMMGNFMTELDDTQLSFGDCLRAMDKKMQEVHELLKVFNQEHELEVATTASVVKILDYRGIRQAVIANVGDSRVYKFSDGKLKQLTVDDSVINLTYPDRSRLQDIEEKFNNCVDINALPQEYRPFFHQRHIVTQCLGQDDVHINFLPERLKPGDKIILMSDGICDNLTTEEIEMCLAETAGDFNEMAEKLVDRATQRSRDENHLRAKKDDMTAIVMG